MEDIICIPDKKKTAVWLKIDSMIFIVNVTFHIYRLSLYLTLSATVEIKEKSQNCDRNLFCVTYLRNFRCVCFFPPVVANCIIA